jgi:predicted lactoylglutathione lyase
MSQSLYLNLPIKNLEKSKAFFAALGYHFNPTYSNDIAACMVVNEHCSVMLLTDSFFKTFIHQPLSDAHQSTEMLICVSQASRAEVDAQVAIAVAHGATTPNPVRDYGFMYQHGFQDLDGHIWELMFMDESQAPT